MPYSFCCSSLLFNYSEHTALIPKLILRNSRTILSIAGTWSAFLVILLVRRLFAANSLQHLLTGILFNLSRFPTVRRLLLFTFAWPPVQIRTSPNARCGYIARSMLPLPAVCR